MNTEKNADLACTISDRVPEQIIRTFLVKRLQQSLREGISNWRGVEKDTVHRTRHCTDRPGRAGFQSHASLQAPVYHQAVHVKGILHHRSPQMIEESSR